MVNFWNPGTTLILAVLLAINVNAKADDATYLKCSWKEQNKPATTYVGTYKLTPASMQEWSDETGWGKDQCKVEDENRKSHETTVACERTEDAFIRLEKWHIFGELVISTKTAISRRTGQFAVTHINHDTRERSTDLGSCVVVHPPVPPQKLF